MCNHVNMDEKLKVMFSTPFGILWSINLEKCIYNVCIYRYIGSGSKDIAVYFQLEPVVLNRHRNSCQKVLALENWLLLSFQCPNTVLHAL